MSDPLPTIDIHTGCVYTQDLGEPLPIGAFSGDWVAWQRQYGALLVNAITGQVITVEGVGKPSDPPGCQPALLMIGDCWQSSSALAMTKDSPKWLVAVGSPDMCHDTQGNAIAGLQVWKWENGTFKWKGLIRSTKADRHLPVQVNGDLAYSHRIPGGPVQKWIKWDLNSLIVIDDNLDPSAVPPEEKQLDCHGFTYSLKAIHPDPPPNPYPGPNHFVATRVGGPVLPTFCPEDFSKRKEIMAFFANYHAWVLAHPGQPLPTTTVQQFSDVPPSSPFFNAINSCFLAGITAGKSPCAAP